MSAGIAGIIAAALTEHREYVRNEDHGGVICGECGWEIASKWQTSKGRTAERMNEHEAHAVLTALAEAGFGNVREAKAEALNEAADELSRLPYEKPDSPDRATYERLLAVRRGNTDQWLRDRAKEVARNGD